MKKSIVLVLLASNSFFLKAQDPDYSKFFFAIITSEIESSLEWYERIGFNKINYREVESMGIKQANLNYGKVYLELIELSSATDPKEQIPDFSQKTKLAGLFKVGFAVKDFDQFLSLIEKSRVERSGGVVNDPISGKRMLILLDPDGNRIQVFE